MVTTNPQSDYHKTALRLPRDLHAEIRDAATKNGHSMNAEIITRLLAYQSFEARLRSLSRESSEIKSIVKKILEALDEG